MTIGGAVAQLQELIDKGWINPIVQPTVKKVIETIQMELQAEPETNADRIRAMTDEELAEMFAKNTDCYWCMVKNSHCQSTDESCANSWLRWLKQESE